MTTDSAGGAAVMSIRYKIFSAFSMIVILCCVVAFIGFRGIAETGHLVERLYDGPLMAINYVRSAQTAANEARGLLNPAPSQAASDANVAQFEALLAEVNASLAVVRARSTDASVLAALERAEERLNEWIAAEFKLIQPPATGPTEIPAPFAAMHLGERAVAALDNLAEVVAAYGLEHRIQAEQDIATARQTMLMLALAAVLSGLGLAALFTRSVSRPVLTAMRTAGRVAAGQFDNEIKSERRDELGALLRSLATMQSSLKARAEEGREKVIAGQRLARMLTALNAINEAIMRAQSRDELFDLACTAAIEGGELSSALIALANGEADWLHTAAAAGPRADEIKARGRIVINGPVGEAYRNRQPCISNDCLTDARFPELQERFRRGGANAAAALPLLGRNKTLGVMAFQSPERGYFSPEIVELLGRLAMNVSLVLEDFDRAAEREAAEEELRYLATHDALTDLPNRTLFSELLGLSISTAERYQRKCAVLFLDLDRFKIINDTLGHEQGDALLIEIARRLKGDVRASDVVARLGGDEFVIVLNEIAERDQVTEITKKLLVSLAESMLLAGQECAVTGSIGVAMYPDDGEDEQTLMKRADMAMYLAKQEGKNDVRFYSDDIKAQSTDRIKMEAHLRNALQRGEFVIDYQPKLAIRTGRIVGVEALLRWQSPELGLLQPNQFIPLVEETGLIVPIGRWVMQTACRQAVKWQAAGLPPMTMAVNVSPRQFNDENLLHDLDTALTESGLDPSLLQIEITESMVMLNVDKAVARLDAIQSRGIRLAIDDFGTGYSSMSMMKRFPIDTIKIDRSFVRDLPNDGHDKAIIQAIIRMGKALGLTIVAEGVETLDQKSFLQRQDCDEIQGFYFSRPVPPAAILDICRQEQAKERTISA